MNGQRFARPNLVLLGVGHSGTTVVSRMLEEMGWNTHGVGDPWGEPPSIRAINDQIIRMGVFEGAEAQDVLANLREPWAIKDPRFALTLDKWAGLLTSSPTCTVLLWLTRDREEVAQSYRARGEVNSQGEPTAFGMTVDQLLHRAWRQFSAWPGPKLQIGYEEIERAFSVFKPRRRSQGPDIRLFGKVCQPGGSGPFNGMYALQRALRERQRCEPDRWPWFSINNDLDEASVPWFWCWEDRLRAKRWADDGHSFIQGPNMLFLNSKNPRCDELERFLLDTPRSLAMFCHTPWYRDLIAKHRNMANKCPIQLWPYPIDPLPPPPKGNARYDLLIYAKSGNRPHLVENLQCRFSRSKTLFYGQFQRDELYEAASQSRAACYLSDDDHGPLALAEILLSGCPVVGIPRGAPFIEEGRNGHLLTMFPADGRPENEVLAVWAEAIEKCHALDRDKVHAMSLDQFSSEKVAVRVFGLLDEVRSSLEWKSYHVERPQV